MMTAELVPVQPAPTGDERLAELTRLWLAGRRSEHTRRAYRLDLASWLGWCSANDLHPADAWPAHIMSWLAELAEGDPTTGRKPERGATRARRLGAVSGWYRWLIRHEAAVRNPAALERDERPVLDRRRAPALSTEQAEKMLAAADKDTARAAAIVYLMTYTGLRVGELIAANAGDVGMDEGQMVLNVRGKGGKGRPVRLNPYVLDRLNRYAASRPDGSHLPVTADQAGAGKGRPLIATRYGNRVDRKEVVRLLRRLARLAGLPAQIADNLNPHTTRATYATSSIANKLDLRAVQQTMGHASPQTTAGYDRSDVTPDRDPAIRLLGIIRPPQRETEETT